jgi:hypothetical protein
MFELLRKALFLSLFNGSPPWHWFSRKVVDLTRWLPSGARHFPGRAFPSPAGDRSTLFCSVHHNLTLTLCELGDHHTAAEALETSRELYLACPDAHTQARLGWVEGKIALGFGHLARAEEAFLAVRRGFVSEGNGYDTAMVSLDLALVYARQGRAADLKQIAEEMHAVFESKEIHREALAALLLFQQAAREERLSVERVEAFIRFFKRARTNPKLRFKPSLRSTEP